ncbi:MAG: LacI family DNA-binding transcriptional regulator [Trueperaceae bacterium]
MRPRLVDVAKRAGVSSAVASTVLNDRQDSNIRVSPETASRVRQAAQELSYLPNPAAQSLAGGKNHILGVFTFDPIFPLTQQNFYHPFLLGIEQEAEDQDYDLLLFTSARTGEGQRQRQIFRGGINRLGLADGAVLLGREDDRSEVSQLIRQHYPFVYIGRREISGAEVPYVAADYASGTEQVMRHLAELGHRRTAYLGSLGDHEANIDRREGYSRAITALGLPDDPSWKRRIQPEELTEEILRGWVRSGITAFIVEDDMVARRLMRVAEASGFDVPSDLSVALLGDPLEHVEDSLPWTMFRIPRKEMGREAVKLLAGILSVGKKDTRVVLPCKFELGVTSGPAPDRSGPKGG